ncbi:GAF domain-containing protein [Peptostreptococcus russellii]|uniref:GAF domain-containing protein n=1 Tax=Peptostreptococcus russellii TaxID=215200 RepID=A0A1H8H918_9FIRM|nr:GAF domain-containing protein [Peptostreptococcus russellii]SEN52544.1 GAF domain-containing protein [Peptostreptococcus russellii]
MNTLLKQYRALIENESDIIAIMSNTSAFIYENMKNLNWAGFYIMKDGELILGPFQGKVACYRINLDRGVCGYCARNKESIIVDDVHKFQDHIACDSASNSELVVPVIKNEKLFAVIDIDSFEFANFSEDDKKFIERVAENFAEKL